MRSFATWAQRFGTVLGSLLWAGFMAHMIVTRLFQKTHHLDTGSFVFLLITFPAIAGRSEAYGRSSQVRVSLSVTGFVLYAFFSWIRRRRITPAEQRQIASALRVE